MRWANLAAALVFVLSAGVQWNDPDPLPWMVAYGLCAGVALAAAAGYRNAVAAAFALLVAVLPTIPLLPSLIDAEASSFTSVGMNNLRDEEAREALGLLIAGVWMLILALRRSPPSGTAAAALLVTGFLSGSCTAAVADPVPDETPHGADSARHAAAAAAPPTAQVPAATAVRPTARSMVARGLRNPRGMLEESDGSLLVATAGSGGDAADGALVRVRRGAATETLVDRQPTNNLLEFVRRDEVFGLAALERGGGTTLVSTAFFEGPSQLHEWTGDELRLRATIAGNLNDLAWDPQRRTWFAVSSSSEELLRIDLETGSATRVLTFEPLTHGQDAVPGYLRPDPRTGDLLVTLFSGSPLGETGGDGTEIQQHAGAIVQIDPDSGSVRPLLTGLTAPTDLDISDDGRFVRVLEFCTDFLDPAENREQLLARPNHGGFRRFSGRLLEFDRDTGAVQVIADGLDTPTNLARRGNRLHIAQGMGTPGRRIPAAGGRGVVALDGFIETIELRTPTGDARDDANSRS